MKCPKCGYLGFETSDRCRNCGYDFSLSQQAPSAPELPLQQVSGAGAPLADFRLSRTPQLSDTPSELDLDRVIGAQTVVSAPRSRVEAPPAALTARVAKDNGNGAGNGHGAIDAAAGATTVGEELSLFTPDAPDVGDRGPVAPPRRAGAPLSVRRSTPDVPRGRSLRPPRPAPRSDDSGLELALEETPEQPRIAEHTPRVSAAAAAQVFPAAGAISRIVAAVIDLALLAAVDVGVLYFTLAIAGLTRAEINLLPVIPFAAFLVLLNGGYLIAFTAAGGQTIGKMALGIRVLNDDDQRVDVGGAVLRAGGCAASLLTAGLGYLPVFFSADGRTLQDRLAGTRVVRVR